MITTNRARACAFALATFAASAPFAAPALAEADIPVCHTQQQLEQMIRDKGKILPDGCRRIRITEVKTAAGRLCAIDMSQRDPGLAGSIVNATIDTQWWTACRNLGRR